MTHRIIIVPRETWKDINENYKISDRGNFMSKKSPGIGNRNCKWKLRKGYINSKGYRVYFPGREVLAHLLVAHYFIGENPNRDKYTTDHIDKDRLNNDVSNLRYATNHEQSRNRTNYNNNVYYDRAKNKYQVAVSINKVRYRKRFTTEAEAIAYRDFIDKEHEDETSHGNRSTKLLNF